MGGTDKLLAPIGGRPLLAWTLAGLAGAPEVERIVLVTATDRVLAWSDKGLLPGAVAAVGPGGVRRHESVAAGVRALERLGVDDERVVLVHDGGRPVVTPALIAAVVATTRRHGAAIPVVPIAETVKRIDGELAGEASGAEGGPTALVAGTVDRRGLAAAQTPQGVRFGLLRDAFARFPPEGPEAWTDEASLLEACRIPVHAIPGDPRNLKVTHPADLARAAAALGVEPVRVGFGHDGHPFGPGTPLVLGGIEFSGAPRLSGHSDGDVALHAVADALLGAAGLGDLGRLFPADARTPRGIESSALVGEVVRRLADAGWRPASVDLTIVGARPRLGSRLDAMRDRIADLLGLPASSVSVKASTGNLDGAEGAGRAISARAVAVVGRAS